MSSCEKVLQGLWDYMDRQMSAAALEEFEKHLELCRHCFTHVEFEQRLRVHMQTKTNHSCPDALRKKIQSLIDKF